MQDLGNGRGYRLASDSWPKSNVPVFPTSVSPTQASTKPYHTSHSYSEISATPIEDTSGSIAVGCVPTPLRVAIPEVMPLQSSCNNISGNSQMRINNSSFFHSCHSSSLLSVPANALAPPPESEASLQELLAPLVAECFYDRRRIAPPNALELDGAFAAISAVSDARDSNCSSYFAFALRSLAQHGFRRCKLVLDKLGLSIRCLEESDMDIAAEQVDFSWSSISDVQDPNQKSSLQGCAVTLGIREPTRLFEAPHGGLALVLRLQNLKAARKLADVALAFKAYEAQTTLSKSVGDKGKATLIGLSKLLLDEHGCAVWSLPDNQSGLAFQVPSVFREPSVYMEQGATNETPCCNLCWC